MWTHLTFPHKALISILLNTFRTEIQAWSHVTVGVLEQSPADRFNHLDKGLKPEVESVIGLAFRITLINLIWCSNPGVYILLAMCCFCMSYRFARTVTRCYQILQYLPSFAIFSTTSNYQTAVAAFILNKNCLWSCHGAEATHIAIWQGGEVTTG